MNNKNGLKNKISMLIKIKYYCQNANIELLLIIISEKNIFLKYLFILLLI